ncbi:receptor-like protein kinase FERONIA [Carya illinoinensis]|uniref:receptor-like protein kinase FERONIA n=1 Tax=Carya illinoinensis TaxID=32201 RepID=UPI001C71D1FD|nr:receptor-like protein kinase FERONIA [Carya illinoinensis]
MQHSCKSSFVHLSFSVFVFLNYLTIITSNPFSPHYFAIPNLALNCGSSAISTDPDGREWTGDIGSHFFSSQQSKVSSVVSNFISQEPSFDRIPYTTARIFVSQFTYKFRISPGPKFIRLHFRPAKYQSLGRSKDYFSVTAGPFTLLRNFSASLTADLLGSKFLVKEFCVNLEKHRSLKITFTPSKDASHDAYGFINGIEIVSMPKGFYYTRFGNKGAGPPRSDFLVKKNTGLEMVHRLNMGRSSIRAMKGSAMMFRKWSEDTKFLVHSGVNPIYNRAIHIKYTSAPSFTAPRETARSARMLKVSLPPPDARLINSVASLAGPQPKVSLPPPVPNPTTYSKRTKTLLLLLFFGVGLGVATVFFLLGLTIFLQRKKLKTNNIQTSTSLEGLCRRFTVEEIRAATNNFERNRIIGRGGCGHVFKGYIDGGRTPVAIKIFGPASRQGDHEFRTEIEMLSKLRHPHLVSLIGYCDDERFMIIVYDFMAHKTLRHHLYNTDDPPLSWKQRLEICIGTARGLTYLHEGAEPPIIHRDVKTSNILLDEDWVAKVSDFGLSRLGPTSLSQSHVTTQVRGTFGYLDPDYFLTCHLTVKSDVYGFGVVLFEVLCARPAVDNGLDDERHSLAQWARRCFEEGTVDQIIDSRLVGVIAPECLQVYTNIAYRCLCEEKNQRPTMAEVLRALEVARELQEISDGGGGAERIMIDEEVPLCGRGNLVASETGNHGDLVHSCPTLRKKSASRKELLRYFSDKAGLKWVKRTNPRCVKASCLVSPQYAALPSVQVQLPDLTCCGPHTTPGKIFIEITNIAGQ